MSRRLVLIWSNPLFRDSAQALLKHPEIEWVAVTSDHVSALKLIEERRPDTILVEIIDDTPPRDLIELVTSLDFNVRLISASLTRNRLRIFDHDQQTLVHAEDLLYLVFQ